MTTPIGQTGTGVKFKRYGGASYVDVANVMDFNGPSSTKETHDVSTFDNSKYRTFITGLIDGGDVTFTLVYTSQGYDLFKTDFESNTSVSYQVVIPSSGSSLAKTLTFEGNVTALPLAVPLDDKMGLDITIKISGEVEDGLPTAETEVATLIDTTTATLNGTISDGGEDTTVTFEYGENTNYASSSAYAGNPVAADTGTIPVSVDVTGLTTATLYHFRVKAVNSNGTAYGADKTFTTA